MRGSNVKIREHFQSDEVRAVDVEVAYGLFRRAVDVEGYQHPAAAARGRALAVAGRTLLDLWPPALTVGELLDEYAAMEQVSLREVAAELGLSSAAIEALRSGLGREPRPRVGEFVADVHAAAARYGVDAGALARLIRRVDVVRVMQTVAVEAQVFACPRAGGETPESA